jgi:membrane-associated PAP2 superfamily phosphatase
MVMRLPSYLNPQLSESMTINVNNRMVSHFLLPLIGLIGISITIAATDVDMILADYFYSIQGYSWAWKNSWLAEEFFHKGGRALSILLALLLLVLLLTSYFQNALAIHKKPLLFLFLATAGGSLLVSILKASLAVSCPWEFSRYGGTLFYTNVVEQLFLRNGEGCFPAGHASAGYAWISCYFFGLYYQSKWRWIGLVVPLLAGVLLGVVQQLRGAHFLSHDLWTLAICWFYSLILFLLFTNTPAKKLATAK